MGGLSMKSRSPSNRMKPGLLAADPAFVPGGIDLGDHLPVLDPVAAGIGDHGAQRLCALFIGLRNDPALGGNEREPDPVRGCYLAAPRMLAVDGRARLALLVFVNDRDEFPVADDLLLELRVVGAGGGGGGERQQAEQQDFAS